MSTADTMPESYETARPTVRPMSEKTFLKREAKRLRREIAAQKRLVDMRKKVAQLREECDENARFIASQDTRPHYFRG